ncbi:hypothetical protein C9374_010288 [Naegleria lovaniensis]|uniref:Uncharacterized protein n=1 Tax=Naegleria lovaniensis TaxID=51637 RepID=A0AA88KG02_NAELO|nr:uncharacterized protein C9374_010288 [Naegleria lovaniensis]KAG2374914.1 hypothetical protein C9374_010288 [Naegleria lovaniensis]
MLGKELIIFGGYGETSYLNDIWGGEVIMTGSTNSSMSSLQELNVSRISEQSLTVDEELANEIIHRLNGLAPNREVSEQSNDEHAYMTPKKSEELETNDQETLDHAFQKIRLLEETVIELSDMVQQLAVSLAAESKKRSSLQKEVSTLKQALHNLTYSINL